jgi:hypothetical protein
MLDIKVYLLMNPELAIRFGTEGEGLKCWLEWHELTLLVILGPRGSVAWTRARPRARTTKKDKKRFLKLAIIDNSSILLCEDGSRGEW